MRRLVTEYLLRGVHVHVHCSKGRRGDFFRSCDPRRSGLRGVRSSVSVWRWAIVRRAIDELRRRFLWRPLARTASSGGLGRPMHGRLHNLLGIPVLHHEQKLICLSGGMLKTECTLNPFTPPLSSQDTVDVWRSAEGDGVSPSTVKSGWEEH